MTAKREKKPDPERTAPKRNGTFYRSKGWGAPPANGQQKKRGGRFGSSVMEALGACQKLLDEQVRRGGGRPEGTHSAFGNLGDQAERMIRTMSDAVIDMSSMWFDYLGSLWTSEEQDENSTATSEPDANGTHQGPTLDVSPPDRAKATLSVKQGLGLDGLRFQPMFDADGKPCRITVDIARGPRGVWLRIVVDDEQAAGSYHALAVDAETGEIGGTLSVAVEGAK